MFDYLQENFTSKLFDTVNEQLIVIFWTKMIQNLKFWFYKSRSEVREKKLFDSVISPKNSEIFIYTKSNSRFDDLLEHFNLKKRSKLGQKKIAFLYGKHQHLRKTKDIKDPRTRTEKQQNFPAQSSQPFLRKENPTHHSFSVTKPLPSNMQIEAI